jgi:hypothetical protein
MFWRWLKVYHYLQYLEELSLLLSSLFTRWKNNRTRVAEPRTSLIFSSSFFLRTISLFAVLEELFFFLEELSSLFSSFFLSLTQITKAKDNKCREYKGKNKGKPLCLPLATRINFSSRSCLLALETNEFFLSFLLSLLPRQAILILSMQNTSNA